MTEASLRGGSAALALAAAVALVGCAENREGTGGGAPPPPEVTHSSAAPSAAPSGPSGEPSIGRSGCVASVEEATARSGDPPGATCLVVGAELWVHFAPGAWSALSVSAPAVLSCTAGEPGARCRAAAPGTAVVSATDGSQTWLLTVRVIA
jgi:hypothetical protein